MHTLNKRARADVISISRAEIEMIIRSFVRMMFYEKNFRFSFNLDSLIIFVEGEGEKTTC